MTIVMASDLPARIIQVLQDFLPADLDLIDADQGGDATPDVANGDYHKGFRAMLDAYPAITVEVKAATPIEVRSVNTDTGRLGADYHVDVACHVSQDGNRDIDRMQEVAFRYAAGIVRVLLIKKDGLETSGDPTRWAELVVPDGDQTYRTEEQSSGAQVRSVTTPVIIRRREPL